MTFGKIYKDKTFQTIIEATALQNDLHILPQGEMTEIGEKVFISFLTLYKQIVVLPNSNNFKIMRTVVNSYFVIFELQFLLPSCR